MQLEKVFEDLRLRNQHIFKHRQNFAIKFAAMQQDRCTRDLFQEPAPVAVSRSVQPVVQFMAGNVTFARDEESKEEQSSCSMIYVEEQVDDAQNNNNSQCLVSSYSSSVA